MMGAAETISEICHDLILKIGLWSDTHCQIIPNAANQLTRPSIPVAVSIASQGYNQTYGTKIGFDNKHKFVSLFALGNVTEVKMIYSISLASMQSLAHLPSSPAPFSAVKQRMQQFTKLSTSNLMLLHVKCLLIFCQPCRFLLLPVPSPCAAFSNLEQAEESSGIHIRPQSYCSIPLPTFTLCRGSSETEAWLALNLSIVGQSNSTFPIPIGPYNIPIVVRAFRCRDLSHIR